ncbi:hypothetical protein ACFCWY_08710 [Streptomyces sp. NPDC056362]|uniref:hypothetical protein n=1 Tax=unclassified Streptomyces TaxID=2593676 RepID=UPI0035DF0A2D
MSQGHQHTQADVLPGTITLCATADMPGGFRWAHLPVDRVLWAEEELREGFRARVLRAVGDQAAPVEVVEGAQGGPSERRG